MIKALAIWFIAACTWIMAAVCVAGLAFVLIGCGTGYDIHDYQEQLADEHTSKAPEPLYTGEGLEPSSQVSENCKANISQELLTWEAAQSAPEGYVLATIDELEALGCKDARGLWSSTEDVRTSDMAWAVLSGRSIRVPKSLAFLAAYVVKID